MYHFEVGGVRPSSDTENAKRQQKITSLAIILPIIVTTVVFSADHLSASWLQVRYYRQSMRVDSWFISIEKRTK